MHRNGYNILSKHFFPAAISANFCCCQTSVSGIFLFLNYTSADGTTSQIPAFDLTNPSAKFEVDTSNGLGGDVFTRKHIISLLTLTLGQEQRRNVAKYPLHHMTYASAKFEASVSNGLGGNAFTRIFDLTQGQGHIKHSPLHHVTYVQV